MLILMQNFIKFFLSLNFRVVNISPLCLHPESPGLPLLEKIQDCSWESLGLSLWCCGSVFWKFSKIVSHSGAFYSLTPDGIRADCARSTHKNLPVVVPDGMRNRHVINLLTHCPNRSRGNLDNFRQQAALSKSSLSYEHLEPFPCKKGFQQQK